MTVEEALKQSGMTDEQIKGLDARALQGFTTILNTAATAEQQAQKAREDAERAQRAQQDMYRTEIAPALDGWANEKATMEAQLAFYRTQAEQAKSNGFVPKDAPGFTPPAQNSPTPGSPVRDPNTGQYMTMEQGLAALTNANWVMAEHMRLFGTPYPDDFQALLREATEAHLPFRDFASKKYGFETKRQEMAANKQKEHDDTIRKETEDKLRREFAEKGGNNPMVRVAESSKFAEVAKATQEGKRKDPLTLSREQRHQQTQDSIRQDMVSNAVQ